jgi:hypothetical protein
MGLLSMRFGLSFFMCCCVLASGLTAKAQTVDVATLTALQTAVHQMCVQPDTKGEYLHLEGNLGVGATLSIAGVNAQGKISKEEWNGISQRLDQYKTDPRACAVSILPMLIATLRPAAQMDNYSFPIDLDPTPGGDNWLALRSEPNGTTGKRLMKLGPDSLFTVFGEEGNWAHIRLQTGETGWVFKKYIACCKSATP